ncbi:transposase [Arthrobacter sp. Hiyo8]|nr:transposase [Arthrobacter sp. Hiyo8]
MAGPAGLDYAALTLPDVDALAPVRFFRDPATKAWKRFEPWMSTIVDLDTGQVLGIVDGRDSEGVGDWLFARPLQWRLGVQVVAIDPSAAFRKALRMWLPRTAVSVDAFHLVKLATTCSPKSGNASRSRSMAGGDAPSILSGPTGACCCAAGTPLGPGTDRLNTVFATDDATGKLQAAWLVKEQLRTLLATGSLADAAAAKDRLQVLVEQAAQPETNRLWRTICRWWKEIEVLIVTGATTAKVEANNTAIKHIKRKSVNRPSMTGHATNFQKPRMPSWR